MRRRSFDSAEVAGEPLRATTRLSATSAVAECQGTPTRTGRAALMSVGCHPTWHEWLVYVANHPGPWLVAEAARRLGPVVRVPVLGALVSDPQVAWALLHDDERFTKAGPGSVGALVTQVMGPQALINMDGPAHRALRDKLRSLFAPAYVQGLAREALCEPLDSLARDLAAGQVVDLVPFMDQLTGLVTCHMLGIEVSADRAAQTYADIVDLGRRLAAAVGFTARPLSPERVAEMREPFERLVAHARDAFEASETRPGSIVHRLRDLGLSFEEVKGVLGTLFLVGTQTTSVALPRIAALLIDTSHWAQLQAEPELLPAALDEALRCTVPVPATIRSVAQASDVGGHHFAAGSRAFVFTYNLAKDARLFPHPERFDLARPCTDARMRNLWYGSGPHFCLGFALAQLELRMVLETLLQAPGELRVVRRRYARNVLLPAYARLEVALQR